jgi:hypothetical protein
MIILEINTQDKTLSMFNRTKTKSKMLMHSQFEQIDEDAKFVIFDKTLFIDKYNVTIKSES